MCTGVTNGLAGMKFSQSPSRNGWYVINVKIIHAVIVAPNMSLYEKKG